MIGHVLQILIILVPIVAEANALYVCEGDDVKLFSNTSINPDESRLTLYHNKDPVGVWTKDIPNDKFKHEKQIKRDENYDIWLYNVTANDQGHYSLLYSKRTNGSRREQMDGTLLILVPPSPGCAPVINLTQDREIYYLNATWSDTGCGTLTWNNNQQNTSMLRVNSTEKPGLFIACIRGPAMDCVRDPTDYCSEIWVNKSEGFNREKPSHAVDVIKQIHWVLIVIPTCIIVFILITILAVFCYCRIRNRSEQYAGVPPNDVHQSQHQRDFGILRYANTCDRTDTCDKKERTA